MRRMSPSKERLPATDAPSLRPSPAAGTGPFAAATLVVGEGLSRTFRRGDRSVSALVSATFRVEGGDRIAIVGSSGSGKSTLLHILGGLDEPTAGTISWPALGPRTTLRPAKVGFVFQSPSLLPALTVLENVALPLLLTGTPGDVAEAAAHEALRKIDLDQIEEKLPEELSGGQAQRVAFARSLAHRPALIVADEPTGQLDGATAAHLFEVVLAALAGSPTALVVATHDQAVAARMSRVWRMNHGTLEGAA